MKAADSPVGSVLVPEVSYQSLYRRYRPQRFSEMLGQDHVVLALKNAVREQRVGHAYLFSGPRGTGKTSTARILAKALNCTNILDGEPDDVCESCVRIQQGSSLDVFELDAASNNGVEAMRDLVSRAALGVPGKWKVYIIDEVHMLSTSASNALLKTLEEPPSHVVFVLATTDPQKVLPTIRSRTQHFEFRLLSPELLSQLVAQVNSAANLQVPSDALNLAVRRGKGSARDALSALDQVAAAGIVDDDNEIVDEIVESLCERDTGRALIAVAEAVNHGRDPQRIAIDLLEQLRNGFLSLMSKTLVPLPDEAVERIEAQARRLGTPTVVRAMEMLGDALEKMSDSPEQRVTLEVAIVRLTKPELSVEPSALLERIEKLERGGEQRNAPPFVQPEVASSAAPTQNSKQAPTEVRGMSASPSPTAPKPALGGLRKSSMATQKPSSSENSNSPESSEDRNPPESPQSVDSTVLSAKTAPLQTLSTGEFPTRDLLVEAWGDVLLDKLPQRARSRYRMGRFITVEDGKAIFALPNVIHRDRCEELRNEVEHVVREYFGVRVPMELTVDGGEVAEIRSAAVTTTAAVAGNTDELNAESEEIIDLSETIPAEQATTGTPEARLLQAFPGAEEM